MGKTPDLTILGDVFLSKNHLFLILTFVTI